MSIHQHRKTPFRVYAGRFIAGHHLASARTTNYTFRYRATRDISQHGHAGRWAHRAGWERACIRFAASAVTLAIIYGYLTARPITIDTCMGALAGLGIGLAIRGRYAVARARHNRRTVRPLYQAMTQIVNVGTVPAHIQAYGENHKRHLRVPLGYRDPKARVRFEVPLSWIGEPGQVRQLSGLIGRRLGGEWDGIPHWNAYPPYVEFIPSPAPPSAVSFKDILPAIERAKDSEIIIGIGTHSKPVGIDLDSESPHVAMSIGTGGGKSSLLRLIVIQLIRNGCERIDIIDPKRVSHNWAKGIPGVFIHRTMADQMQAVADFRARMEARYEELDLDDTRVFPRQALLIEEQNSFMDYAKTYWEDYRNELDKETRAKTPKRPPVIGNLGYILFQGRQARMNVFSVFQRMSASASGGGDMRVNYGAKILARFDHQAWNMLVGTRPVPRSSRINGRGRFVFGDDDREIQMAYLREKKGRDWPGVPESQWKDEAQEYAMRYTTPVREDINPLITVSADGAGSDEPSAPMTLRELVDAGIVPIRYSSATRARTRAGDSFPKGKRTPIGMVYEPGSIREFFASHARN